jgi:hypothetical protein
MGLNDDAHNTARMVAEGAPEAAQIEQEIIGEALRVAKELSATFDEIITRDSEAIYLTQYQYQNVEYAKQCASAVEKLTALLR